MVVPDKGIGVMFKVGDRGLCRNWFWKARC